MYPKARRACGVAVIAALFASACLATQDASLGARAPREEEDEIEAPPPALFDAGVTELAPMRADDAALTALDAASVGIDASVSLPDASHDASADAAHHAANDAAHDAAPHFDARALECWREPWECR